MRSGATSPDVARASYLKHAHDLKAKSQLSQLIAQAERGEEVIIARGSTPVARLLPYVPEQPKRGFGSMKGRAWLDESFWEPLPEEELKLWEGG